VNKEFSLWLGSEASKAVIDNHARLRSADNIDAVMTEEPIEPENGVLVLPVTGSLAREEGWWGDSTSYETLADNLYEGMRDDSVDFAILNVDSPGGSPYGLSDVTSAIQDFSAAKPIYAYVAGGMHSAAYWLGTAADRVFAPPVSSVGSIGVIAVHHEVTEALKEAGIAVKVFRTAEYKALANPYEKATDKMEEDLMRTMAELHTQFVTAVAEHMGISFSQAATWANGKTYGSKEALKMGMIDEIGTFNDVLRYAAAQQANRGHTNMSISARAAAIGDALTTNTAETPATGDTPASHPPPPAEPAAAAAEPVAAAVTYYTTDSTAPAPVMTAPVVVSLDAGDGTVDGQTPEPDAGPGSAPAADPATPEPAAAAEPAPSAISELTTLLAAAQKDAAEANTALTASQEANTAMTGQVQILADATAARTRFMQVALGQTPTPLAGMSVAGLIEVHATAQAQYAKLPAGAIAQGAIDLPTPAAGTVVAFSKTAAGRAIRGAAQG